MAEKLGGNVIKPASDVVASMAGDFKQQLMSYIERDSKSLTVDLDNVKMVDSVGLGVILAAYNTLRDAGGELKIVNVSTEISSLFKAMRLDQHFEIKAK